MSASPGTDSRKTRAQAKRRRRELPPELRWLEGLPDEQLRDRLLEAWRKDGRAKVLRSLLEGAAPYQTADDALLALAVALRGYGRGLSGAVGDRFGEDDFLGVAPWWPPGEDGNTAEDALCEIWARATRGEQANGAATADYQPPPGSPELEMMNDLKICTDAFWLIEKKLPRCSMILIYGPSGCGKTYLLTSVALGLGMGRWLGSSCERGAVLICAFERAQDTRDRVAALRTKYGFLDFPVAMLDLAGKPLKKDLVELIIYRSNELAKRTGLKVLVIAVDTLRAALGGRPEGDEAFGEMRLLGEDLHARTGAMIAWLHHEGKGEGQGPRSHLALADGCMAWWRVDVRESGERVLHVEKANRGPEYLPLLAFRLAPFEAALDDKGVPIELCSVEETNLEAALASPVRQRFGKPPHGHGEAKLGDRQKILMRSLRKLYRRHPDGVDRSLLRSDFIVDFNVRRKAELKPELKLEAAATAFRQALASLRDRDLIDEEGDLISPVA